MCQMVDTQLCPQNPEALHAMREPSHLLSHTFSGKSLCHCLDGTPALQKQTHRFPATGNRTAPLRDSDRGWGREVVPVQDTGETRFANLGRFGSEILRARHSAFQEAIKGLALTFHKSGGMLKAKISLCLALNDVWDLLLIIQSLYPEMKFFLYCPTFHSL